MSKKYTDIDIEIKDIEFPNKGIGIFNGKKVTVKKRGETLREIKF